MSIQEQRIQRLNQAQTCKGEYVLYWMQQAQRAHYNHALEYAVQQANRLNQRVLVVFGLMDGYPEANLRHYRFMLEGLQETQKALNDRGIRMVVRHGQASEVALSAARKASLAVCDRAYLSHLKQWRRRLATRAACPVVQVETDVVVPLDVASSKAEYAARTLRPKLHRHWDDYLVKMRATPPAKRSLDIEDDGLDLSDLDGLLDQLRIDRSVAPVSQFFKGGTRQAKQRLRHFIDRIGLYDHHRNQPQADATSHMSPYLHFGQISPVYLALRARAAEGGESEADGNIYAYLEELIVRRELAHNFVHFNPRYDKYSSLPDWARQTLAEHRDDKRAHRYTRQQLENAETHDAYWNAAQREMTATGYMHNYMRMYWGKKILEWSGTPEYAYRTALALNNKYFLDGRDANSYANIGWCFGLHDRPWKERPVFGKIRYMNAAGLRRKCDPDAYIDKIEALLAKAS